ncbi:MAG: methionyl-tRNA formyltransferase, partial [Thermoanaerobaculia bacterium]
LTMARLGFFNVHGSILPSYRGAAPIQRAIEAGETTTGVSIMRVDEELDHGPVLATESLEIGPDEHTPSVASRLSQIGAHALVRALGDVQRGRAKETPQDHSRATYAAKIDKSEGRLTWDVPARVIYNRFRAFDPWPGVTIADLKLIDIKPDGTARAAAAPGTIHDITNEAVVVATGDGALDLLRVQRPGKSPISAADHARAAGWRAGERL